MNIFDAHFHIINPNYPLVENNGYLPQKFTVDDYKEQTNSYNIVGGVVVSGSFQAFDQEYLIDALSKLGKNYVGVANIPLTMDEKELFRLKNSNIVAVRFNLKRGGSASVENLQYLSDKLFDQFGWHTELYVDSKNLKDLKNTFYSLQKFSIDHLGLSKEGLSELFYWAERGMKIKVTGFGRIDFKPIPVLRKLYDINPNSLMFGTDLPSTRAMLPFSERDITLIKDNFNEIELEHIFFKNAYNWYIGK